MAVLTVVDCSTVIATHLSHLMQLHAAKLLGRWAAWKCNNWWST